jgi:hypothetical protein
MLKDETRFLGARLLSGVRNLRKTLESIAEPYIETSEDLVKYGEKEGTRIRESLCKKDETGRPTMKKVVVKDQFGNDQEGSEYEFTEENSREVMAQLAALTVELQQQRESLVAAGKVVVEIDAVGIKSEVVPFWDKEPKEGEKNRLTNAEFDALFPFIIDPAADKPAAEKDAE